MSIKGYEVEGERLYDVYVHVRGKTDPGIRIQKRKTKIRSLDGAKREEAAMYGDAVGELVRRESKGTTWGEIVDGWERAHLEDPVYDSPLTAKEYASMARRWTPEWRDVVADRLNRGDGRRAIRRALESGKSRGFVGRIKSTVNVIFNWAVEEGLVSTLR